MKFSTTALFALTGLAQATECPPRNPDGFAAGDALTTWVKDAVNGFFPYRDGWDSVFDQSFSPKLQASMNATKYDFDGFKALFGALEPLLAGKFAGTFIHDFSTVIGVPNAKNRGGFVTLTGWEGGYLDGDKSRLLNVTDASFAVIEEQEDCELRIVEWRETSNLGF